MISMNVGGEIVATIVVVQYRQSYAFQVAALSVTKWIYWYAGWWGVQPN
jgi:hypothetical protein